MKDLYDKDIKLKMSILKMKIWILLCFISCVACTSESRYSFCLDGDIQGVKYGTVFLMTPTDSSHVLLKTDLEKGKFVLRGELDEPGQFILKVNRRQIYLFLDGKKMKISCPYTDLNSKHLIGSPSNDLALKYEKIAQKEYYSERNHLLGEFQMLQEVGEQKKAENKMNQILDMENKLFDLTFDFIKQFPDNLFSAYIANVVKGESWEKGTKLYNLLTTKNQKSYFGKMLKLNLDDLAISALGESCPDFITIDESGKQISMESQKGEIIVLDFWASWCGPCRQEMKNLKEQYEEFKEQNVRFISISLDDSSEQWEKACKEEQIPWLSVRDEKGWADSEIRKLFGIQSLPFIVLLDKEGKIVAKNIRREALRENIIKLTKEEVR